MVELADIPSDLDGGETLVGSSPTLTANRPLAQLVEHFTHNEAVNGSNPLGSTNERKYGNRQTRLRQEIFCRSSMVELVTFNHKTMVRFHPAEQHTDIAQLVEHLPDTE